MAETELDPEPALETSASLNEIDPARSRHMWRRSGVALCGDLVVVGTWNGDVTAFEYDDAGDLLPRWTRSFADSPVTISETGRGVAVGGRGDDGAIALLDPDDGAVRWRYDGADDVGAPAKDSVFYWPYVVDLVADPDGETLFAAVRRYERDGEDRIWHSAVLAFGPDGDVRWRYEADASPIALSLDARRGRLAVGYNRCFGDHQRGLVVLDADDGAAAWHWDPGVAGDRRVGDVSFDVETGALAATSHGDYRGYLFGADGETRWHADLATEVERAGQTLYAYPNHAVAHDGSVAFVTGNTYARESRDTEERHPDEHTVFGYDDGGDLRWTADTGGFVHEVAAVEGTLVLPTAQNFRVRDAETHSVRAVDLRDGVTEAAPAAGIVTSAATDGERVAAVEEPIEYHDENRTRGSYTLHVGSLESLR